MEWSRLDRATAPDEGWMTIVVDAVESAAPGETARRTDARVSTSVAAPTPPSSAPHPPPPPAGAWAAGQLSFGEVLAGSAPPQPPRPPQPLVPPPMPEPIREEAVEPSPMLLRERRRTDAWRVLLPEVTPQETVEAAPGPISAERGRAMAPRSG